MHVHEQILINICGTQFLSSTSDVIMNLLSHGHEFHGGEGHYGMILGARVIYDKIEEILLKGRHDTLLSIFLIIRENI